MIPSSRLRRLIMVTAPAVIPLCAALTGCRPDSVTLAAAGTSVSPAAAARVATAPAADAPAAAAATAPAGSGSVTAGITSPVSLSGSVSTTVSCTATRIYRAHVASALIEGDQLSFTVTIPRYRGQGAYPSVLTATLSQATGEVTTVAAVPQTPAVITSSGGSLTFSATGTAGRTLRGSLGWTCG